MKKIEFTKKIMTTAIVIEVCVTVFACVMMWRTGDLTPLGYMLVADGGALSVAFGSYAWKEKNANRNKYAMLYVDKIAEKYDIETALRMAEIVLKD